MDLRPLQAGGAALDGLPEGRLWGLIDPAGPALAPSEVARFERVFRNAYAARLAAPDAFVQIAPEDDALFAAPLVTSVAKLWLSRSGAGLAASVSRYWQGRRQQVRAGVAVLTALPELALCRGLRAAGAEILAPTPVAALSARYDRTLYIIGNTPADADAVRLQARYGGDALVLEPCPLRAFSDAQAIALAERELGRPVPVDELRQWREGIARPPVLLLGEIAAAARRLFVLSPALAVDIRARFGCEAIVPPPMGASPSVVAHASGVWAESCVWAAEMLEDWGLDVSFDLVCPDGERAQWAALARRLGLAERFGFAPGPAQVTVLAGSRGQTLPLAAAMARSDGALIATEAVAEAIALPVAALLADQPSPLLLAEAIANALPPSVPSATVAMLLDTVRGVTVWFDVSQFVLDPRRSGIQRVERALMQHWPGPERLALCRYDAGTNRLHGLPDEVREVLCREAPPGGVVAEAAALAPHLQAPGDVVPDDATLFCAELFVDAARADFHRAQARRSRWLIYDCLPWTHPEWYPAGPANHFMPYLHAARAVRRGYISAASKRDFARITRRTCSGPVFALGADGWGLPRQAFTSARRDIVMLGTVEARKNLLPVLAAFRQLWRDGVDARLTLIGRVEPDALAERAALRELSGEPWLRQLGVLADDAMRDALRGARALLFPSVGEGYGLPPTEALWVGMPVIVASTLPALEALPGAGQIRLNPVDADNIAAAVRRVLDDAEAAGLWDEAAGMPLPGWADFAREVAVWLSPGESPDLAPG